MSLRIGAPGLPVGMPEVPTQPMMTTGQRRALTEGIPDPEAVQRQKEEYARSLEEQLRKGVEVLAATHKQQTDLLHAQATQEKQRYNLALDQQVKQQELALSQHYNQQLMRLQQAAQAQRADLEQQACGITLEYQQRKVQEEYMAQQLGIHKQHVEAQAKLNQEIQKLGVSPSAVVQQVPPVGLPPVVTTMPPSGSVASMDMARSVTTYVGPATAPPPFGLPSVASVGQASATAYATVPGSVAYVPSAAPAGMPVAGAAPMQASQSYIAVPPSAKVSYSPPAAAAAS